MHIKIRVSGSCLLDIDIIWYNEALAKRETSMNDAHEDTLLMKFPPAEKLMLDTPCVVVDSGLRIIFWYVPKCLSSWVQVGDSASNLIGS
jgi:hypothetical protein